MDYERFIVRFTYIVFKNFEKSQETANYRQGVLPFYYRVEFKIYSSFGI